MSKEKQMSNSRNQKIKKKTRKEDIIKIRVGIYKIEAKSKKKKINKLKSGSFSN